MKKLFYASLVFVTLFGVTGCGKEKETVEEKEEVIIPAEVNGIVLDAKTIDGLVFSQITAVYDKETGMTNVAVNVTNSNDSTYELGAFYIDFKAESGESLGRVLAYVGDTVDAGETRTVTAAITNDLSSAVDYIYELN